MQGLSKHNSQSLLNSSRLLIVDGDDYLRSSLRQQFLAEGFHNVFDVGSLTGLNEALKDANPDLILLDIYMPKLDGFDFLNAYSKTAGSLRKHPILMVITSTIRKTDIQKMEGHPLVSGVLKKPLEVDHLKTILNA